MILPSYPDSQLVLEGTLGRSVPRASQSYDANAKRNFTFGEDGEAVAPASLMHNHFSYNRNSAVK